MSASDIPVIINKTVEYVLTVKHRHKKSPLVGPVFISVYITEDLVKSVMRRLSRSSVPEGTGTESPLGCLLKFAKDRKRLQNSIKTFALREGGLHLPPRCSPPPPLPSRNIPSAQDECGALLSASHSLSHSV